MKTYLRLAVMLAFLGAPLVAPSPARAAGNTITVTGTADDATVGNLAGNGTCDLREALKAADTNLAVGQCPAGSLTPTDVDTIAFSIPGGGVHSIALAANLQAQSPQLIDGTTQPGYSGSPLIRLDGNDTISYGLTMDSNSDGSTVKGLMLTRFTGAGLYLFDSDDTKVLGDYIGTDGSNDLGSTYGIMTSGSANIDIGGTSSADRNIIAGNFYDVYLYTYTTGATLQGNYIGVYADGATIPGSGSNTGIMLTPSCCDTGASFNLIGGLNPGEGNVIAGHSLAEIRIPSFWNVTHGHLTSDDNTIQGNIIGLDASGTAAPSVTTGYGIQILNSDNTLIEGNVISGKSGSGISLEYDASLGASVVAPTSTVIRSNWIGTGGNGSSDLGNGNGIYLKGAVNTIVGGNDDFAKLNVISGNAYGIRLEGGSGNVVNTNWIGTGADGTTALPNSSYGIHSDAAADVTRNWVANSPTGIYLTGSGSFSSAADNCLSGNTTAGLDNTTGSGVTFENSYWGASSGPSGQGPGTGDAVSLDVDFDPFLTSAPAICEPLVSPVPTSLSFGSQLIGTSSAEMSVTLSNPGARILNISSIVVDAPFVLAGSTSCPVTGDVLAAGTSCQIDVRFAPVSAGLVGGNITVTSDADSSPDTIALDGTGLAGTQLLTNESFEFDVDNNKKPDGWTLKNFAGATDKRDCSKFKDGACSLKFVGNGKSKSASQTVLQSGAAGDDFTFSLWSRAKSVPSSATYRLQVKFYDGTTVLATFNKNFTKGTHGFKQVSDVFEAPGAYDKIVYKIIFKAPSGTAWFDAAALNWAP